MGRKMPTFINGSVVCSVVLNALISRLLCQDDLILRRHCQDDLEELFLRQRQLDQKVWVL